MNFNVPSQIGFSKANTNSLPRFESKAKSLEKFLLDRIVSRGQKLMRAHVCFGGFSDNQIACRSDSLRWDLCAVNRRIISPSKKAGGRTLWQLSKIYYRPAPSLSIKVAQRKNSAANQSTLPSPTLFSWRGVSRKFCRLTKQNTKNGNENIRIARGQPNEGKLKLRSSISSNEISFIDLSFLFSQASCGNNDLAGLAATGPPLVLMKKKKVRFLKCRKVLANTSVSHQA